MATRAKTELILILAEWEEEEYNGLYQKIQEMTKTAADEGLVEVEVLEGGNQIENEKQSKGKVMMIQHTPLRERKVLVAKRRIKKIAKEIMHPITLILTKGLLALRWSQARFKTLSFKTMIGSENKIENTSNTL